jgi:hypothetical protein
VYLYKPNCVEFQRARIQVAKDPNDIDTFGATAIVDWSDESSIHVATKGNGSEFNTELLSVFL